MSRTVGVFAGIFGGDNRDIGLYLVSYVLKTEELLNLGEGVKRRLWKKKEQRRVASADQGRREGFSWSLQILKFDILECFKVLYIKEE